LAQRKAAAEGSRRENTDQEGGRNLRRQGDFEARGLLRANLKLQMAELRAGVNPSKGGRRTSLRMAREIRAALGPVYPDRGIEAIRILGDLAAIW